MKQNHISFQYYDNVHYYDEGVFNILRVDKVVKDYMLNPFPYEDIMFRFSMHHINAHWPVTHVIHWHEEIEIIYQFSGEGFFQVNSNIIRLDAGQAIIVNSGEYHSTFQSGFHSTGLIYCIGFESNTLNSGTNDTCQIKYIDPLINGAFKLPSLIYGESPWERDILSLIKNAVNYFQTKPFGYELAVKSIIMGIIAKIIMNNKMEPVSKKNRILNQAKVQKLKKVLDYINSNYSKKLAYKDISSIVNMNQAYFCRFFKSMIGQTPIEYINHYRINKAASLLCDKQRKITDIAMEVGFENTSYFIQTFKQLKKCTPNELRYSLDISNSKKLPDGWHCKHVGPTVKPGSAIFNNNTFTIAGFGLDIANSFDEFQFVYRELTGDCCISVKVTSIQETHPWAKAGIMFRETLNHDSKFVHAFVTPSNGISFEMRSDTSAQSCSCENLKDIISPVSLKLVKSGHTFTAFYAWNDCNWFQLGPTETIGIEDNFYMGLSVTSHNISVNTEFICTATFENVCLSP